MRDSLTVQRPALAPEGLAPSPASQGADDAVMHVQFRVLPEQGKKFFHRVTAFADLHRAVPLSISGVAQDEMGRLLVTVAVNFGPMAQVPQAAKRQIDRDRAAAVQARAAAKSDQGALLVPHPAHGLLPEAAAAAMDRQTVVREPAIAAYVCVKDVFTSLVGYTPRFVCPPDPFEAAAAERFADEITLAAPTERTA